MEFKKKNKDSSMFVGSMMIDLLMTLLNEQVPGNFLQNLLVIYKY